jgi:hypothetical protein
MLLATAARAQNFNLGALLRGVSVQSLPVNVGACVDADYGIESRQLGLGLSGEVLFPVYGPLRARATLLQLVLSGNSISEIRLNTGAGLDLMYAFARTRARLWPYAFLGGDLTLRGSNFDYALLLGLGLEGRLRGGLSAFGEAAYSHSYESVSRAQANNLHGRVGVRLGR